MDSRTQGCGWPDESPAERTRNANYHRGYVGGFYRIDVNFKGWIYAGPPVQPSGEFSCEIVGRVYGDQRDSKGAIILNLACPNKDRAIRFRIHTDGRVTTAQSEGSSTRMLEIREDSPNNVATGATALNALLVHVRTRKIDVFVNGRRVGETLTLPWDELPNDVSIGVTCQSPNLRGELDRFELRELDRFASASLTPAPRVWALRGTNGIH